MIGMTISHYKILEKLGEGGMGVVYKAHDTTLDRDVALKFLPPELTRDPDAKERFIHEAKSTSILQHPNICTIHEIDETADGQLFIVMDLYEGETLKKKIERGPLPIDEAINIISQAAQGLAKAHEAGIVHRDIKPANIIITRDGVAKILDFGLAKVRGRSHLTRSGTTLGTAAYMSPEQARGEKLDQRTDLWSLGVVLYEMVTGHLPFCGEHEAAILYSVVNEQPQPIEVSVADASPELIHVIGCALEKDPADRYQSAADMLIDLRRLKRETSKTGFVPVSGRRKKVTSGNTKALIAGAVVILIAAAAYFFFMNKGPALNPDYSLRWLNLPFNDIGGASAATADGKWIVFGAQDKNERWDLYIVSAGGGEPRAVTQDSSDGAGNPNISPDGTSIVYNQVWGKTYNICTVPFNGGVSKKIGVGNVPQWAPDGKRIGYVLDPIQLGVNPWDATNRAASKTGKAEFWTMNPDGSENTLQFTDTVATWDSPIVSFAWAPDGKSVAWLRMRHNLRCDILIHDLTSHAERFLISEGTGITDLCWAPNGQIIYAAISGEERNLWTVPASGGAPVRVTKGIAGVGSPRVSPDARTVIFRQTKVIGHLWLAKTDGSGQRTEVKVGGEPLFWCPSISPDGKYITAVIQTLGGLFVRQVFIFNRDGTDLHQITSGDYMTFWPTWSPDGKKIFYYARRAEEPFDSFKVYVVNVPKFDTPRYVSYGADASWADSATIELLDLQHQQRFWRVFLDGRPPQPFSQESVWAKTVYGGKYVLFADQHQRALHAGEPTRWCRSEEWDGIGPKNATALPRGDYSINNYDALYRKAGEDIYRISYRDWSMTKVNVNREGIDPTMNSLRIRDGKEMIYTSNEAYVKIGIIEYLFK